MINRCHEIYIICQSFYYQSNPNQTLLLLLLLFTTISFLLQFLVVNSAIHLCLSVFVLVANHSVMCTNTPLIDMVAVMDNYW